jgi:orotate phosphoribosyltransferase
MNAHLPPSVARRIKTYLSGRDHPLIGPWYRRLAANRQHASKHRLMARLKQGQGCLITMDDMLCWTRDWVRHLPQAYDVIVGIPRSGLLVANILALKLGKPCTTPDLFGEQRMWQSKRMPDPGPVRRVLLVDDSVNSGTTMAQARKAIQSARPGMEVTTAALVAHPGSRRKVDLYYIEVPQPRLFEWDIMHQKKVERIGVVFEGFLALPITTRAAGPKGNGGWRGVFMKPYLIPTYAIDLIIGTQSETRRGAVEAWLRRHGVRFRELVLWNRPDPFDAGAYLDFVAAVLALRKPDLYLESDPERARHIWQQSATPTLCTEDMRLHCG